MSESDLTLVREKFSADSVSEHTKAVNAAIVEKLREAPTWEEVGAPTYRALRAKGEGGVFPPITVLADGINVKIPSREEGRDIPCRIMYPPARKSGEERKGLGVLCHFHGGGWVLGDEKSQDKLLEFYANAGDVLVISVGYRLAPEHPYPAPVEDRVDAVEYLLQNAERDFGVSGGLKALAGESAGAHLATLLTFHLLKTHPSVKLTYLLLHFGCYDLSGTPSRQNFSKRLVLNHTGMSNFVTAFLPHASPLELKSAALSPLYEDFTHPDVRGRLPPALFTVGTEDPLLDDSVFMAAKWGMGGGGEAVLKVYEGAPHGFFLFPMEAARKGFEDTGAFVKRFGGEGGVPRMVREAEKVKVRGDVIR